VRDLIHHHVTKMKRKSSFLFFHNKGAKATASTTTTTTTTTTYSSSPSIIDGQGAFTVSSSLASSKGQSIQVHQSIISCRRRPTQGKQSASKSKARIWPVVVSRHPSCVVFFSSITASRSKNIITDQSSTAKEQSETKAIRPS
jgi:hypothetical protein